jgi:sulfite exporter TauE/SafE
MIRQLAEGIVLGLATGTSCLATCGPVYTPYLMQTGRSLFASLLVIGEISAGRFVSYLAVGALAGAFGQSIADEKRIPLTIITYILFSVFLILTSVRSGRKERYCIPGRWYAFVERPFLLGLLTGVNLCPPFLLALARTVNHAGVFSGMLFFAAFFIGTTVFLLPLAFAGMAGRLSALRRFARFASIGVAAWFILQAGLLLFHELQERRSTVIETRPMIHRIDTISALPFSAASPRGYIFIGRPLARQERAATRFRLQV